MNIEIEKQVASLFLTLSDYESKVPIIYMSHSKI